MHIYFTAFQYQQHQQRGLRYDNFFCYVNGVSVFTLFKQMLLGIIKAFFSFVESAKLWLKFLQKLTQTANGMVV